VSSSAETCPWYAAAECGPDISGDLAVGSIEPAPQVPAGHDADHPPGVVDDDQAFEAVLHHPAGEGA
jgi:hypothetical protein